MNVAPGLPDLSLVIVTFNSDAYIADCLRSIEEASAGCRTEVVVVDNASQDSTVEVVREVRPSATVVMNDANLGFAAACNQGLAASSTGVLALLNPDTQLAPGSLTTLAQFLVDNDDVGVVAPRLLNPDGTDQQTARSFPTPLAAVFGRRSPVTRRFPENRWSTRYLALHEQRGDAPFEIDWVSGACLMTTSAVLDQVGGLDDRFFMYWEDADFCRRVKAAGYQVMCEPSSVVGHDEGARRAPSLSQIRHFHSSAYHYYSKHHLTGARVLLRPLAAAALAGRAAGALGASAVSRRQAPSTDLRACADATAVRTYEAR